jgi:hypothetical protein
MNASSLFMFKCCCRSWWYQSPTNYINR